MSEELDLSGLDDSSKEKIKKDIENVTEEMRLKRQWRKELEENAEFQEYLKQFNPFGVPYFVDDYIRTKYYAYLSKKYHDNLADQQQTLWIDRATDHLADLLQKKLFDMQCLWRAEQLTIEGVDITFDFVVWGLKILDCPFIELNEDDVEMYQDFLRSGKPELYERDDIWQDYEDFKQTDDGSELDLPLWYEFHNEKTGNGVLLHLRDVRGEKENVYQQLYWRHTNPEPVHFEIDPRPSISQFQEEVMEEVAKRFEDSESRKTIQNYLKYSKFDREEFDEIIAEMRLIEEDIPIESNSDYKEGVKLAYKKYFFGKIADHLPMAYEHYLFSKKMNLNVCKKRFDDYYLTLREEIASKILKGRELNGEPRDFNF